MPERRPSQDRWSVKSFPLSAPLAWCARGEQVGVRGKVEEREWAATAAAIDACRQQLRECERAFGYTQINDQYEEEEQYQAERASLGYRLRQAHLRMLILIEHAGLPLFHNSYSQGFEEFASKLDEVEQSPHDTDDLFSDPLTYIGQNFDALTALLREESSHKASSLALFERILRQTPYILADREIVPTSEKEVRKPIFDLLKTVFPDCRREISVSHLFKVYKADLGIPSLKALAEVKYALDEAELRSELDGIYADINGYAGDPQWTRFFAVFYTANPVAAPERVLEEFKLSRVDVTWTPIIVHGAGTRPGRRGAAKPKLMIAKPRPG